MQTPLYILLTLVILGVTTFSGLRNLRSETREADYHLTLDEDFGTSESILSPVPFGETRQMAGAGDVFKIEPVKAAESWSLLIRFRLPEPFDKSSARKMMLYQNAGTGGYDTYLYLNSAYGGALNFRTYGPTTDTLTSRTSWEADKWYTVLIVCEANRTKRIYVDGKLENEEAAECKHGGGSRQHLIGDYSASLGNYTFIGDFDEIALWDKALTSKDAALLYEKGQEPISVNPVPTPAPVKLSSESILSPVPFKETRQMAGAGDAFKIEPVKAAESWSLLVRFRLLEPFDKSSARKMMLYQNAGTGGYDTYLYLNSAYGGALNFRTYGPTTDTLTSRTSWEADKWYTVLIVCEANRTKRIYVDGKLENEEAAECKHGGGSRQHLIGDYSASLGNYTFIGDIDEIALWDKALTSKDAALLYEKGQEPISVNPVPTPKADDIICPPQRCYEKDGNLIVLDIADEMHTFVGMSREAYITAYKEQLQEQSDGAQARAEGPDKYRPYLFKQASLMVRGVPEKIEYETDERGLITTRVTITVQEVLRGAYDEASLAVVMPGGCSGVSGDCYIAMDLRPPVPGEEGIFLLTSGDDGAYLLLDPAESAFRVFGSQLLEWDVDWRTAVGVGEPAPAEGGRR